MITENLSTLKIHKLTQEQYERELAAGRLDETALYLTPDEEIDLSGYVTEEHLNNVLEEIQTSDVSGQIETHNTSENAHSDIRGAIRNLNTLVGDTSVSDQITTATQPYATKSYVDDQRIAHTEYVTILPETTLTFEEADVESGITLPEKLAFKPNTIYLVNWNGVEYEYKSSDGDNIVYLGNRTYHHPLNARYDGYGPFRFQTYYDFSTDDSKVFVNAAGTYTVSISEVVFHKIDTRYYEQLAYVDYDVLYPVKTISVVDTTTVTAPSNTERTCYWYQLLSADLAGWANFEADSTYLVNWNGTEYECKCNDLADGIGDPYWFGDTDELTSGEPFFLFHSFDDGLWVYTGDSGECTIEVSEIITHKIDEKYLPNMDTIELISTDDIDEICGATIYMSSEVEL